jgi:hypothetical protein
MSSINLETLSFNVIMRKHFMNIKELRRPLKGSQEHTTSLVWTKQLDSSLLTMTPAKRWSILNINHMMRCNLLKHLREFDNSSSWISSLNSYH